MTNQQAINILNGLEQSLDDYCELNDEGKAAFRMAITALELFGNSEQLSSAQPDVPGTNVWDTIYRQAAINAMCDACSDWCDEGVCKKVSALQKLPPAQQWISCDKGEPDEDMECWVTVKTTDALYRGNFTKRYGERRDKGFITSGGFMWWNTALAWMPIYEPEPYRTEGDDNHEG